MKIPKKLLLTLVSAIVFAGFAVSEGYAQPGRASYSGNNGQHRGWTQGRHRGWDRGRGAGFNDRRYRYSSNYDRDQRRYYDRGFIFAGSRNRSTRNRRFFNQYDRRRISNRNTRLRRSVISRRYY